MVIREVVSMVGKVICAVVAMVTIVMRGVVAMGTRGLVALVAKVTCKSGLTGLWLEKKTGCTSCHFIPPGVLISGHRCH